MHGRCFWTYLRLDRLGCWIWATSFRCWRKQMPLYGYIYNSLLVSYSPNNWWLDILNNRLDAKYEPLVSDAGENSGCLNSLKFLKQVTYLSKQLSTLFSCYNHVFKVQWYLWIQSVILIIQMLRQVYNLKAILNML